MLTQIKFGTWDLTKLVPITRSGELLLDAEVKEKFTEKLGFDPQEFCGRGLSKVVRKNGLKLVFEDGSWVGCRLSGTKPVVRVYSEARNEPGLEKLSTAAKQWIFE
jgi:phosphoglucomutase